MKPILCILFVCAIACNNSKKNASSAMPSNPEQLNGSWTLTHLSAPGSKSLDSLYPGKKPRISFTTADKRVSGNTGCNSFSGPLEVDGNKINFNTPLALTKMFCAGDGESVFLENLKKVNSYSVSGGNTLHFIMGDIAIMQFKKE